MAVTTKTKPKIESLDVEVPDVFDAKKGDLNVASTVAAVAQFVAFDVGQGDCTGLIDDNDEIFLYVDYGGLYNHPDKGNYSNVKNRLPAGSDTVVILTHWDWDHYNSAKHNADARDAFWLTPRQLVGPNALKFANSLKNAKCWPDSVGNAAYRFPIGKDHDVMIEKIAPSPTAPGSPEDRNLTGLCVTLIRKDASGADEKYVLWPGDAPYDRIPTHVSGTPAKGDCIGFVAYHHGARSHWSSTSSTTTHTPTFVSGTSEFLIFSYGDGNSYKHPDESNYQNSGNNWTKAFEKTPDIRASGSPPNENVKFPV